MEKRLKFILFVFCFLSFGVGERAFAQEKTTLADCYKSATENYPLARQRGLIASANALTIKNLNASFMPQVELGGQATWQSEVTKLELPANPLFPKIEPLSQDQYKMTLDIRQNIYDGGMIKQSKAVQNAVSQTEIQKLEIELFKVRDRVNQLYFSILQADENIKLVEILKADLMPRMAKVKAGIDNGIAIPMNQRVLEAELLKADQRLLELQIMKKSSILMLNQLVKGSFSEKTIFEKPISATAAENKNNRPELRLFSAQQSLFAMQSDLTKVKNMPRLTAFATGGYGKPGLNFLKNEFRPYAIVGVAAKWNLTDKISKKESYDKELLAIQGRTIELQKEAFLLNSDLQTQQLQSEIEKYKQLIISDKQIIDLRQKNKFTSSTQLDNGIITANDFIIEANAENQARQNLTLHELQLLMSEILLKTTLGN